MYQVIKESDKEVIGDFKWFHFHQNNSGGYFIEDDEVVAYVFIQATTASAAVEKALQLFEERSEFCECCGERWDLSISDEDGTEAPMLWGEPFEKAKPFFGETAVLHYANGKIERFVY